MGSQHCPNGQLNIIPIGKPTYFPIRGYSKDISYLLLLRLNRLLLVPCDALGISPVRVDEERTLDTAPSGVNLGQVELGPRPAVPEVGESDALEQGGARLLVAEQPSLLLHGGPHDREAEVDSHPSCEQRLCESNALEVHKAKVGLVVLKKNILDMLETIKQIMTRK